VFHVDCEIVIRTLNKANLYSTQDCGQHFVHATRGIALTQFRVNNTDNYTIINLIGSLNYLPLKPLNVNLPPAITDEWG
jgi:hypothetical protein